MWQYNLNVNKDKDLSAGKSLIAHLFFIVKKNPSKHRVVDKN